MLNRIEENYDLQTNIVFNSEELFIAIILKWNNYWNWCHDRLITKWTFRPNVKFGLVRYMTMWFNFFAKGMINGIALCIVAVLSFMFPLSRRLLRGKRPCLVSSSWKTTPLQLAVARKRESLKNRFFDRRNGNKDPVPNPRRIRILYSYISVFGDTWRRWFSYGK